MQRLVEISVSALKNCTFIHDRDPIRAFLWDAMHPADYASTLQRAFGADMGDKTSSLFRGIDAAASVQLRNTFRHALAHECCALLAALNLDLDMLHAQVAKTAGTPDSRPVSFSERMTVERIRERLIEKVRVRPGCRPSQCGREYRYLRRYDASWLVRQKCDSQHRRQPIWTMAFTGGRLLRDNACRTLLSRIGGSITVVTHQALRGLAHYGKKSASLSAPKSSAKLA